MTSPSLPIPRLERPAFFEGQQLGPDDLEAIHDYHRELRWLHNRTLHNWGIAVGLDVSGDKGDRIVRVAPGYGVDCEGHDLLLSDQEILAVPAVAAAGTWYLTASWIADQDLAITENRQGVCTGPGAVRRAERLRLRWQRPMDLNPSSRYRRGLDLILATAQIEGCVLSAPVSNADRRYALPDIRPYIVAGSTPEGETPWAFSAGNAGVETFVDTSAAGFGRTPVYLAHLVGTRAQVSLNRILDGFGSVEGATPAGFTFRVLMPRNLSLPPYTMNPAAAFTLPLLQTLQDTLRWSVTWTGIED
ncbi:MAG TPA: hypothetical protein VJU15_08865 [Gemmatimonadales bacterium]|nr:hypothetical protein [Gemmatimonadales bacterium]